MGTQFYSIVFFVVVHIYKRIKFGLNDNRCVCRVIYVGCAVQISRLHACVCVYVFVYVK